MMRISLLAVALAALCIPQEARAQSDGDPTITASCAYGGYYDVRGGPVTGGIWRYNGVYTMDAYLPPLASWAAVGTAREEDSNSGWLRLNLRSPSLNLSDSQAHVQTLSIQARAVVSADQGSDTWRVRLSIGEEAYWYGPGAYDQPVFTTSSFTVTQPYGYEPYIGFFDREEEHPGEEVYRRLIAEGSLVAEFHVPRRGLRAGYLFAVSEFSLAPLQGFLTDARAHFAACDAASGE